MSDDKSNYWGLAWDRIVKGLGVPGLTPSTYRLSDRDSMILYIRYHGNTFSAEISGLALISPDAKYAVHNIAEKMVEEICEWLASGLSEMVNLLPKDWDGDKRPGKLSPLDKKLSPTNTWENLFKDDR